MEVNFEGATLKAGDGGHGGGQGGNVIVNLGVTSKGNDTSRDPIPPRPRLFLGRDALLREIVKPLLDGNHVALLGSGGIGKSSIAKAVLHDATIVEKFGDQRYFVRFDDMDFSQVSFHMFFERIAKALGVKTSSNYLDNSVRKYLSDAPSEIFLVLDNAETFLQAGDKVESSRIAQAIEELGDMKSVKILLTTRIAQIPLNHLARIKIPPLDEEAAYATFSNVYGVDVCPSNAKNLISALQFHPLSIILLARVAKQNEWSTEKLAEAWERRQTQLLSNGDGKTDNLDITIELSLNSPSIQKLGEDANHFMHTVAFLPQGVDKEKLKDLFPEVTDVDLLSDTLRSHSLLYLDGNQITMLAPIRLYLTSSSKPHPTSIPLFAGVRTYYYSQLTKLSENGQEKEGHAWITTEDINVEHLIALDLGAHAPDPRAHAPDPRAHESVQTICGACVRFIKLLIQHKQRPTTLYSAVMGLPQNTPGLLTTCYLYLFGKVNPLVSKGQCVQSLGLLADNLGQTTEALKLYNEAKELFIRGGDRDAEICCVRDGGDIYSRLGDFVNAEDLVKEALSKCRNPNTRATLNVSLGYIAMFTRKSEPRDPLIEAECYFKSIGDIDAMNNAIELRGYGEVYAGNYDVARRCFKQLLSTNTNTYTLVALSEVSSREGDLLEALALLDDGMKRAKNDQEFGLALAIAAALNSSQDDFIRAREQIQKAIQKATHPDDSKNYNLACFTYISARNELFAQELPRSEKLFSQAKDFFLELSDIRFQARCQRALGEIAFLRKDIQEANAKFVEVRLLCKRMHISEELLYVCSSSFFLKDSFEGWKMFQETHAT